MTNWMKNVRQVEPYVPGEQPVCLDKVKLNTNENPYPPAPEVAKVLTQLNAEDFSLYPDPTASELVNELAKYYDVNANQVFVGVGSDDVLAIAFMTFFNSDKPILFPNVTYSFYKVWAELYRIPYYTPKLDQEFKMVKEHYFADNGGIIFPNPNAPTGIYEDLATVEEIIQRNSDVVVIVDEAYIDFGGKSALELIDKYDNLLVVHTYSKSRSMAGMRIGYAIGNPLLIKALNDVKYSFNSYTMNMPSLKLGAATLKNEKYFHETVETIVTTREHAKQKFIELGFSFPDSKTNFLFVTHKEVPAVQIFKALREKNIFVRHFNDPIIDNYLRITIGTEEEMNKLYKELERILK